MPRPNGQTITITKTPSEIYVVAAALGLTGVGLILLSTRGQKPPLKPGEEMGNPITAFDQQPTLSLPIGTPITIYKPTVMYKGPGRDTFTYFQIKQLRGGQEVSVYGSGVAGVHVGPSDTLRAFDLVSLTQKQPDGSVGPYLTAYIWGPGPPIGAPLCGAPPERGPANVYVEIYQKATDSGNPADADGFSAPTCNPRKPIRWTIYPGKVVFT